MTSLVEPLRDFLVRPSPILSKLNKYARDGSGAKDTGTFRITVTQEGQRCVYARNVSEFYSTCMPYMYFHFARFQCILRE